MPRTEAGKALAILVPGNYSDLVATIDAIEREASFDPKVHRCIPDRDALARALRAIPVPATYEEWKEAINRSYDADADAIIAALKEQA